MIANAGCDGRYALAGRRRAFTLIELLTVIAIISLLIGILVPSLSHARAAAKDAKSKAAMKSIGDGLELFRNENDTELHGNNYPLSTAGDDPTETLPHWDADGNEDLFGAQWLVRYLMGKDLNGYIPRRNVPAGVLKLDAAPGEEQIGQDGKSWYEQDPPLNRDPLYVAMDARLIKQPSQLAGWPPVNNISADTPRYRNPVFVDAWEMPILYYAANTKGGYTDKANANITAYKGVKLDGTPIDYRGIYTYRDNALFTGLCTSQMCDGAYPQWKFAGADHKLFYLDDWTSTPPPTPAKWAELMADAGNRNSFSYTIMNKEAFESTGGGAASKGSVIPLRKDSFLLLSPGKDGVFGTADDIWNFK